MVWNRDMVWFRVRGGAGGVAHNLAWARRRANTVLPSRGEQGWSWRNLDSHGLTP